jgi:hypothetical protein
MKCPTCNKAISTAMCESIQIQAAGYDGYSLRGVAYNCPLCRATLSVQADPVALNDELIVRITRLLK